jgi:hypothetical protein
MTPLDIHSYSLQKLYKQNRTDYLNLQNIHKTNITKGGGEFKNNFYFIHTTLNSDTLTKILKDGFLRPSIQLKEFKSILSAERRKHIYTNINFDDLKNVEYVGGYKLFMSPKIIYDYDSIFNRGWFVSPYDTSVFIYEKDDPKDKISKITSIKEYLKNPTFYPKFLIEGAGYLAHEMLFDKEIDLKKYLIGIECDECDLKELNDLLKKEGYENVKIYVGKLNAKGLYDSPSIDFFNQ